MVFMNVCYMTLYKTWFVQCFFFSTTWNTKLNYRACLINELNLWFHSRWMPLKKKLKLNAVFLHIGKSFTICFSANWYACDKDVICFGNLWRSFFSISEFLYNVYCFCHFDIFNFRIINRTYRLVCLKSTTPEELYARKVSDLLNYLLHHNIWAFNTT